MIIKFAIIAVILGAGSIIFASQLLDFFPETATTVDLVKKDLSTISENTAQQAEHKVDETLQNLNDNIEGFKEKSNDFLSQGFLGSILVPEEEMDNDQAGSVNQNQVGTNGKTTQNNIQTSNTVSSPSTTASTTPQTLIFETLSLTTSQEVDGMVMLHYEDSSGKTISVSVTLRNSERELFNGVFFSSMFETFIDDASETPYFIDMIVEHEEYGTINSSVYNTGENKDTTINGVFSKS